jgi:transposase-like protein
VIGECSDLRIGDRLVSKLDHTLEPEVTPIRRLEVVTGTGRRRRFSEDDKARVVEETLSPGAVVSHVARRHGLTPQQLFTWRREARERAAESKAGYFAPVVMATRAVPDIERNVKVAGTALADRGRNMGRQIADDCIS